MTRQQSFGTMLLLATIIIFFSALPADSAARKRTALIIGNSNYRSTPLANPVNDATDMAAILRKLGFDVIVKTNADRMEMLTALEAFQKKLHLSDAGLFYFAGHGMQIRGYNYLIPVNVQINSETDVEYESVSASRVLAKMEEAGSKINIIILDACRNNPLKRSFRSTSRGLSIMQASRGSFIAYATSPGSVASDGSGRNGVYTRHLLQHITKRGVTVEEVFRNVRKGVYEETHGAQLPWDSSSLMGSFYLAGGTPSVTPQVPKVGRLHVHTNPPDARIRILNIKPQFHQGIELVPGDYHIEIAAQGYDKQTHWVRLSEGEDKKIRIQLSSNVQPRITNNLGMDFIWIEPGTFIMGTPSEIPYRGEDENPHEVTISPGFYMQTTEVTIGQFREFIQDTGYHTQTETSGGCFIISPQGNWTRNKSAHWNQPSYSGLDNNLLTDNHPVTCVSWNDARKFVAWLREKEGHAYDLATEAQWEYACRAGSKMPFSTGKCLSTFHANYGSTGSHFSDCAFSPKKNSYAPLSVGKLKKNGWGLFDLHGNVAEWSQDWYGSYSLKTSSTVSLRSSGMERVVRGGHFFSKANQCRSAKRSQFMPDMASQAIGFRLVIIR